MKKRIIGIAFVIAAFISVTSGCYVGYGYRHHHHHDRGY